MQHVDAKSLGRPRQRLDNLTALRFFAAFSVFLHHLKPLGIDLSPMVWGLNLGWTVSFFFVLSGFVLAYSYGEKIKTKQDAAGFIAVRFFRLWPLHVVCLALAIGVRGFPMDFDRWYLVLTLQQSMVPSYETAFFMNAVSWSISDELFFYITFAALSVFAAAMFPVMAAWTAVVFCALSVAAWTNLLPFPRGGGGGVTAATFFHLFPPVRIVEFFAGICVFAIYKRWRLPTAAIAPAQAACIVLLVLVMMVHIDFTRFLQQETAPLIASYYVRSGVFPIFAVVVYVFAHQHGPVSTALSTRLLVWLGETSFALYMIHQIVVVAFRAYIIPLGVDRYLAAVGVFAVSVAAAAVLYKYVELPSLAWAKRKFDAPKKAVAGPEPLVP